MRLRDRRYLAGDDFSIADIASYPWTLGWQAQGQDIDEFKHFKRWFEEVGARPAVQRGLAVGSDLTIDPSKLSQEEKDRIRKILYNQRALPLPE
jgi:GST-like protein